jgi:cytochrome c oxidase cbb3-type subunit 3
MTQPQDVLRQHTFDGDIVEFDNRLPNWWLWSFYLACIFAFVYWVHYHILRTGPSPQQEFTAQMAEFEANLAKIVVNDDVLLGKARDPLVVAAGQTVFTTNCVACHASSGGGTLTVAGQVVQLPGPNLTDRFWLHGGKPSDIYRVITQGVPNTAMVAWSTILGVAKCQEVAAYLLTIRNTEAPGGKAPQGQEYAGN